MHPPVLDRRRAGILLHPSSLPDSPGNGDLGHAAYRFVDFLAESGLSVWQTLPLGPVHADGSPYLALSVHAGNPDLISLELLAERGWLERQSLQPARSGAPVARDRLLGQAHDSFRKNASAEERQALAEFRHQHGAWLESFSLFVAIKQQQAGRAWTDWPQALRDGQAAALEAAREQLAPVIEQVCFEQYQFYSQWLALKQYANERGVLMFGDMPIFVAHDSADVWCNRRFFDVDESGQASVVAGVPPDYFSETGQRWGNPHYRWDRLQEDGFLWWIERIRSQLALFDLVRVDHFRGFEAHWEIPGHSQTALEGRWVQVPGQALFEAVYQALGRLPLVAEDLGQITPEVHALRHQFGLPGMKILQFAFGGGADNPYLPHHHEADYVVYTGTHDNDTTLGWFESLAPPVREHMLEYLGYPGEDMPWPLIRCALASVARLAIVPMQDILALGSEYRMNIPGTEQGNWQWRFQWQQLAEHIPGRLRRMVELYHRS
jgi:4-alpha-glucanotransferase